MCDTIIQGGQYKGSPSIVLENECIRAEILPGRGAKIASLILKEPGGRSLESLWQIPGERYGYIPAYGDAFGAEDGSGFDDMCPTIAPYTPKTGAWKGVPFPDHGEVWALSWECSVEKEALRCSVTGIRAPYRLTRTVRLAGSSLKIDYSLKNLSTFTLPFQWAAHAIFRASEGSALMIPKGMNEIINAFDGKRLSGFGKKYSFPYPDGPTGSSLQIIPGPEARDCQKYWFSFPVSEGWCGLKNTESGLETMMRFDPEKTPYLGIWINAGGWNNSFNVGLEPSTSIMDDPETAERYNGASFLDPGEKKVWGIEIQLSPPV